MINMPESGIVFVCPAAIIQGGDMRYLVLIMLAVIMPGTASAGHDREYFEERFDIASEDLRVRIDIDYGKVRVRSSGYDGVCGVSGEYDPDLHDMDIRYDRGRDTVVICIDREDWPFHDKDGDENLSEFIIELPERPYLHITADIKAGSIDFRFGGLAVERFELDTTAGETTIDFDRPNRAEMDEIRLHLMVGESNVLHLGNARFHDAYINSGIGELEVDFSGSYTHRCNAKLDLDIGKTRVTVPDNIGVRMRYSKFLFLTDVHIDGAFEKRGGWYYCGGYRDDDSRSLTLEISSGIGELTVDAR